MDCDCNGPADEESTETATDGGRHDLDVLSRPLPDELGRELGAVYGGDFVGTYGEWLETMAGELGRAPTTDDLCCVDDARHRVEVGGETTSYICVIDPLIVPHIRDAPAVVRSRVPGTDGTVTARIAADGELAVAPDTAVVSFGASSAAGEAIEDPVERGYAALCEFTHAFPDEATYVSWDAETDAVTKSLPYADAAALARAVADRLI